MSDTVMVYAIYWPELKVLKVGRAWKMSRVRGLMGTGGRLLLLMRDRPLWEETAALAELDATFEHAFAREWDAYDVLPRGRGFTECFVVSLEQVETALATIFRGIARYGNQQAARVATGDIHQRGAIDAPSGGEVDRYRTEAARGRPGAGEREPAVAVVEHLAAVGGRVGGRRDPAPAHARGGRVHLGLLGGREDVLPSRRLAEGRSRETVTTPTATRSRIVSRIGSRSLRGCGGGERGRVARGERTAANHSRVSTVSVLSCSPGWDRPALSELWDSAAASRPSGGGSQGGRVRGSGVTR